MFRAQVLQYSTETAELWKFSSFGKTKKNKKLFFQYLAAKKTELMKLPRAERNAAEKEIPSDNKAAASAAAAAAAASTAEAATA